MKNLKVSRKAVYGTLVVVAIAGFWFTREEDPGVAPSRGQSGTTARQAVAETFTEEDYNVRFPRLEVVDAKNVFRPGVVRSGLGGDPVFDDPHMIPPEFAHGETDWIYTGTAEIDGVPVALIENAASNDGVFLKHGEQWRAATVLRITPDLIVLAGPRGSTRTVLLHNGNGLSGSVASRPLNAGPAVERAMAEGVFITPERPRGRGGFPIITDEEDDE